MASTSACTRSGSRPPSAVVREDEPTFTTILLIIYRRSWTVLILARLPRLGLPFAFSRQLFAALHIRAPFIGVKAFVLTPISDRCLHVELRVEVKHDRVFWIADQHRLTGLGAASQ